MYLDKIRKKITSVATRDGFVSNVFKVMQGNVIAQVISVLAIPVITRLFSPARYGEFNFYCSLAMTFSIYSSLSYSTAIILPEEDEESVNVFGLSIICVFFFSLIVFITVLCFQNQLARIFNMPALSSYLWFLPLSIFLEGVLLSCNYWALRKKRFKQISTCRVSESAVERSVALTAGFAGSLTLIASRLCGLISASLVILVYMLKCDRSQMASTLSFAKIIDVTKKYKKFPLVANWSIILMNMSRQMPVYLIAFLFSSKIIGQYALSTQVLALPMMVIGDALFRVYYQKLSEINDLYIQKEISFNLLSCLIYIITIPMCILTVSGKEILAFVFGPEWEMAGSFTQIMAILYISSFLSRPFNAIYYVVDRQEVRLIFDIIAVAVVVVSFAIGGFLHSIIWSIVLCSLLGTVVRLLGMFWAWKYLEADRKEWGSFIMHNMKLLLPFAIVILFVGLLFSKSIVLLIISYCIIIILYGKILSKNKVVIETLKGLCKS